MRRRIIVYGVVVLAIQIAVSMATFSLIAPGLIMAGPGPHARGSSSGRLAAALALEEPAARQHILDEAKELSHVEISLYAVDGELLATNVQPPLSLEPPPPPPGEVLELGGGGGARAVIRPPWPPPPPPGGPGVLRFLPPGPPAGFTIPLVVTLICLVLLSFPLAGAMTRRLETLAQTARAFGEGDLDRRADASGADEVAQTARAFNTMADRIGESRRRERELLANVSHELRTPMARMAVLLELVESNPAAAGRYVGELARDLRELEKLLDDIIDTLRLDLASAKARDPWPARREELDLRDLAADVVDDFRARAPARTVAFQVGAAPVVRSVDRTLMRRALLNLLANADQYSPQGTEISLAVEPGGALVVSDRGPGIDPGDLPHLFEPFFRGDKSRTRATGGVGLGLTFVQRVAGLHGGSVTAHSQPGEGATFRLSVGA